MTEAVPDRQREGLRIFVGKKKKKTLKTKKTNILIIFTAVMVKVLHAHCNIIINVPMRKE